MGAHTVAVLARSPTLHLDSCDLYPLTDISCPDSGHRIHRDSTDPDASAKVGQQIIGAREEFRPRPSHLPQTLRDAQQTGS
jgi:hypothetical protein